MSSDNSVTPSAPISAIIPLPVALYESNGIIFELYRGGRASAARVFHWERLKTFEITREGDLSFHVRVSQAVCENCLE